MEHDSSAIRLESSVDVLRRASITALTDIITTKRLRWFGHVSRMLEDRLPNYLLEWKPKHGKRSRDDLGRA